MSKDTAMMQQIQLQPLLRWCLNTYHGRIIAIGIIAGFVYLPVYIGVLIDKTTVQDTIVLNLGCLYVGFKKLWTRREELVATKVLRDDRLIGHLFILGGALWIPFAFGFVSLQAFLWIMVLTGMAWSSFGPRVFSRFPLSSFLALAGMYPNHVGVADRVFRILTGPYLLENLMAWLGSIVFKVMGYAPEVQGRFLSLPQGAVEVGSACSGFDMALVLAAVSFMWGLYLEKSWQRIAIASWSGIAIALTLNVPRIILVTFAAVYWGQESFDFWHGFWGGQIFSALMFTVYYYVAMAIFKDSPSPSATENA